MKTYELTAHDGNTKSFIAKQFYSNKKAALGSFDTLKEHLLEKYNISPDDVQKWDYSYGGLCRTDILGGRNNLTLNMWDTSQEVSTWIKD